jgi:hypothetical protein
LGIDEIACCKIHDQPGKEIETQDAPPMPELSNHQWAHKEPIQSRGGKEGKLPAG